MSALVLAERKARRAAASVLSKASGSSESDAILGAVTGEGAPEDAEPVRHPRSGRFTTADDPAVVEAAKVLRNPAANATERRIAGSVISTAGNGGDVVPVDAAEFVARLDDPPCLA